MDFLLIAILLLTTGNLVRSNSTANPCTNYCSKGGVCLKTPQGPKCICLPRWTGERCEMQEATGGIYQMETLQVDQVQSLQSLCDVLEPDYCLHDGTCDVENQQFICRCKYPYTGERCQNLSKCFGNCLNQGVCYIQTDGKPKCKCPAEWGGEHCEKKVLLSCDAVPANYCNLGTCFQSQPPRCVCPPAYTGETCEILVTPKPPERCSSTTCQNGGRCFNNGNYFYCFCPKPYSGERCEINSSG